jgi:hypothetical protein
LIGHQDYSFRSREVVWQLRREYVTVRSRTAIIALSAAASWFLLRPGLAREAKQHDVSKKGHLSYALRRELQAKVSKKGHLGAFGYAPPNCSGG